MLSDQCIDRLFNLLAILYAKSVQWHTNLTHQWHACAVSELIASVRPPTASKRPPHAQQVIRWQQSKGCPLDRSSLEVRHASHLFSLQLLMRLALSTPDPRISGKLGSLQCSIHNCSHQACTLTHAAFDGFKYGKTCRKSRTQRTEH